MDTNEFESLVAAARAGDVAAFGRIVTRFAEMAYGYAHSLLGDFHLAEDAAQEAFIEAYRNLGRLKAPVAFPAWLRRIVHYRCTRMTRGKRLPTANLDAAADVASPEPGPSRAAEDREMTDRMLEAIAGLPQHERTVTTLFYINGYSQGEIAEFLEVPEGTVKSRLNASRRRLKERMMVMVEQSFQSHKLPEDFTGKVVSGVPALAWGESGNTTYIAAVSSALSVTERAIDYASLMVYSGLALRLRYVRRKDGRGWDTVGPVGQFEEEVEAVTWATGCGQPWVRSRDPEEMRRRIVAAVDSGYCPTAYIRGDNRTARSASSPRSSAASRKKLA